MEVASPPITDLRTRPCRDPREVARAGKITFLLSPILQVSTRQHRGCYQNSSHPGGNPGANLKSISYRCYLEEVAFVWALTKETIHLPLGCLQGGSRLLSKLQSGIESNLSDPDDALRPPIHQNGGRTLRGGCHHRQGRTDPHGRPEAVDPPRRSLGDRRRRGTWRHDGGPQTWRRGGGHPEA